MKIVKPSVTLITPINTSEVMAFLERCGRTCYKSSPQANKTSSQFVESLIRSGHESVLEHYSVSFRIICDRGVSHELVRHRLASYSQESTRYCNYGNKDIEFIKPIELKEDTVPYILWKESCERAEIAYNNLLKSKVKPETARSVLPNSLKTEIVMTANLREWRHFLKLRYAGETGKPHPDMKEIAFHIYSIFNVMLPSIVFDIKERLIQCDGDKISDEQRKERIKARCDALDRLQTWQDVYEHVSNAIRRLTEDLDARDNSEDK